MFTFHLVATDGAARSGRVTTPHGIIETPAYLPVATQASVHALSSEELHQAGVQALIANTYHLHLRPGEDLIEDLGGLHGFMNWNKPLVTDSGGFQVFSLGAAKEHGSGKVASFFAERQDITNHTPNINPSLVAIDEDGVDFVSYIDGSRRRFTPEAVVEIQRKLGADITLVLDECTSPLHDYDYTRASLERTHRWAIRALDAFQRLPHNNQALWGIVQGGRYHNLREESAAYLAQLPFDGYALGGALGSNKDDLRDVVAWTTPVLPPEKPRHLLGMGEVEDIFEGAARGVDLFDCIIPTLLARTGTLLIKSWPRFRTHILNACFKNDSRPIEEGCGCPTCSDYSRAYLRHLFLAQEPLGARLAAFHNIYFIESLMEKIRTAIKTKRFAALRREWLKKPVDYVTLLP